MKTVPILVLCLLLTACSVGITGGKELEPVLSITTILSYAPGNAAQPDLTVQPTLPAPTPTPWVDKAAAPKPTSSGPVIQYFNTDMAQAVAGDTIALSWASTGATEAVLEYRSLKDSTPTYSWKVDTTIAFPCQINPDERDDVELTLRVRDEAGRSAQAKLHIELLTCSNSWFFSPAPRACGMPSIVSQAAEQRFEHGTMIWVKGKWSQEAKEEGYVFILYDDGRSPGWTIVKDQWVEGTADRDPTLSPPPGLQQPIRGFGLAWRQEPEVRQRLGWAVGQEQGFDTTIQHMKYKYGSVYLRAFDGNVWRLGLGCNTWEKIAVEN